MKIKDQKTYLIWYKKFKEKIWGKEFDNHNDAIDFFCSAPEIKNNYIKLLTGNKIPPTLKDRIVKHE